MGRGPYLCGIADVVFAAQVEPLPDGHGRIRHARCAWRISSEQESWNVRSSAVSTARRSRVRRCASQRNSQVNWGDACSSARLADGCVPAFVRDGRGHRADGDGLPAECPADLADVEDAAFIVVGSRGRGAFKAAILGSVSRDLIGIARCPVLVVPPGAVVG